MAGVAINVQAPDGFWLGRLAGWRTPRAARDARSSRCAAPPHARAASSIKYKERDRYVYKKYLVYRYIIC